MRYTVVWTKMADGHLANLWIQASDRQAVADAGNRIDVALREDRTPRLGHSDDSSFTKINRWPSCWKSIPATAWCVC
jgi:hypothetical protein